MDPRCCVLKKMGPVTYELEIENGRILKWYIDQLKPYGRVIIHPADAISGTGDISNADDRTNGDDKSNADDRSNADDGSNADVRRNTNDTKDANDITDAMTALSPDSPNVSPPPSRCYPQRERHPPD